MRRTCGCRSLVSPFHPCVFRNLVPSRPRASARHSRWHPSVRHGVGVRGGGTPGVSSTATFLEGRVLRSKMPRSRLGRSGFYLHVVIDQVITCTRSPRPSSRRCRESLCHRAAGPGPGDGARPGSRGHTHAKRHGQVHARRRGWFHLRFRFSDRRGAYPRAVLVAARFVPVLRGEVPGRLGAVPKGRRGEPE